MRFVKGDDYRDKDSTYHTYGIDNLETGHGNQIEVYRDESLRDQIIKLLNSNEEN